jgi:hypothetical protein
VSDCIFCGKPAGFLHHRHHDCAQKHEHGRQEISNLVLGITSSSDAIVSVVHRINQIADQSFVSEVETKELSTTAWSTAVDHSLQYGVLNEEVEERLVDLKEGLSISSEDLRHTGAWDRLVKSAVLRDLMHGVIPKRIQWDGDLPLNFQKSEQLVWIFQHSEYLEEKTSRQYIGGSRGISVRIMKGVYYHVSGFKGRTIDRTERVHVDTGLVAVTTKHLYFSGTKRSFRIPYTKVVSFEPFSNGLGIMRDAASAKTQIFVTHDGWFTYNLVANLAHL